MIYSYSRLQSFENCPRFFKFRYIQKIPVDDFETIERFLGNSLHKSLEWYHKLLAKGELTDFDSLVGHFFELWNDSISPDIIINRGGATACDYFGVGVECLSTYFISNSALVGRNIFANELRVNIDLFGDGAYRFVGFIDRVDNPGLGVYEIHDYKSGSKKFSQNAADTDRQLGLYELGLRQKLDDVSDVFYFWHFLRHGVRIKSQRSSDELLALKNDLVDCIHRIDESIVDDFFPRKKTPKCSWCEYQSICFDMDDSRNLRQTKLF